MANLPFVKLGARGPQVSRLCLGTLTMGPLQKNLSPSRGGALIAHAYGLGVTFVDTAEIYETYAHIGVALKECTGLIISTKTYAYDEENAEASFRKAVEGIGRDYIDVFLLHEQESEHTLRGHERALNWLAKRRDKGDIGAIGISTHCVEGVQAATKWKLDVVHPLINMAGLGIMGGTLADMEAAVQAAHAAGLGVYAMKSLGGGHLIPEKRAAVNYVLSLPSVDAVAVGVQSEAEIDWHAAVFSGQEPRAETERQLANTPRALHIHDWCKSCGACVSRCPNRALDLDDKNMASVNTSLCALCGYCASVCPQFCIKVL